MKRMLALSLGLAFGMAVAAPAFADDNFPDVPANHWAYDALENLKNEGILVGYPDGKFRGSRLATRYEMAVAINAAYKRMMSMADGLSEQLAALEKMVKDGNGGGGEATDTINAMKAQLDGMKGWGDDVASMKKLVGEFEKELTGLGQDVDGMKEKLGGLEGRVAKLEAVKFPISISGDLSFYVTASNSRDKRVGINKEGRIVGSNEKAGGAQAGFTRTTNVYHELAINIAGTNDSGPKWGGTIVYGNALGTRGLLADTVTVPAGLGYSDNNSTDIAIDNLAVTFSTSLVGLGFDATVGRIKAKVSPYLFQRPDHTYYFTNDRWDDGCYRMDGAMLAFKFGGVDLSVLAGRDSDRRSVNGVDANPIGAVDGSLGAVIGFNLGTFGRVNAAYLYHDIWAATPATAPNRINVMGADAALKFGGIAVNAGYGKSIMTHNTKNIGLDRLNQSAFANATYGGSNWGVTGEYRKIQRDYAAAGSWRRIGTNWNPTNIQTFMGSAWIAPTATIKLSGSFEGGETIEAMGAIPSKTKIESMIVGVDYKINDAWTAKVGYEDVKVKVAGNNIKQRWASLGLGYNLGTNALLNFAYEYGTVNQPFGWGFAPASANPYRGGFLTTQLTIRY